MSDHSHRAERVRPTTVRMAELAERLQLRRMGSSGDGARRLEAAVARVVQARAARPAHGDPELSAVPSAEGRPQAGTRLGELLVREGTISGGQRDAALCRQAGSPRLLGEILVEAEMLTAESLARCLRQQCGGPPSAAAILPRVGLPPEYLAACLQRQRRSGEALSDIIRDLNLLSDEAIAKVVAIEHGLSYLPHTEVDHLPVESVRTAHIAPRDYRGYVPIAIAHGGTPPRLSVALSDVRTMQQAVQDFKSYQCHFHVATRATCATIHQRFFAGTLEQVDAALDQHWGALAGREAGHAGDDGRASQDQSIRELLGALLLHACCSGADGLAFQPSAAGGVALLRIDGVWTAFRSVPKALVAAIPALIGAEGRTPEPLAALPWQERAAVLNVQRTLHPAVRATPHGTATSIAIRAAHPPIVALNELGFGHGVIDALRRSLRAACGVIIVCGPASSGCSTTLRGLRGGVDPPERQWISVDAAPSTRMPAVPPGGVLLFDSIESRLDAGAVWEAAEHGSLAIAALRANGVADVIGRLEELGIGRRRAGCVMRSVVAQRLVRKLCSSCKVSDDRTRTMQALAALAALPSRQEQPLARMTLFRDSGAGCADCQGSGYRGRRLIAELVPCGSKFRDLLEVEPRLSMLSSAVEGGTLREQGLALISDGVTSLDELMVHLDLDD